MTAGDKLVVRRLRSLKYSGLSVPLTRRGAVSVLGCCAPERGRWMI